MGFFKQWQLECDECCRLYNGGYDSLDQFVKTAKGIGWVSSADGDNWYCPDCKQRHDKKKEKSS